LKHTCQSKKELGIEVRKKSLMVMKKKVRLSKEVHEEVVMHRINHLSKKSVYGIGVKPC